MVLVVGDTQFFLQDLGNPSAGPELALKTIRFRSVPKEIRNQRLLWCRQLRMAAMRMRQESRTTAKRKLRQPLTHRLLGDPHGLSDIAVKPAQTRQLHRSKTSPFTPIVKLFTLHPTIVSPKQLKLAAQLSVTYPVPNCRSPASPKPGTM